MSAERVFPDDVRATTATAKTVYATLRLADGPLTKQALVEETGQSKRAVETALSTLANRGVITKRPDATEPRRPRWCLNP